MIAKSLLILLLAAFGGMSDAAWAANVAPVASDEQATLVEGSTRVLLSLSTTDPDSSPPFTHTLVRRPAHGRLEIYKSGYVTLSDGSTTPNRIWYYTPNFGFSGTDSFTWKVSDVLAESNTATYTLTVTPNSVPVAKDRKSSMLQGETRQAFPMVVEDPDTGQSRTFTIVTLPAQGTLELNDNGSYVKLAKGSTTAKTTVYYTPKLEFSGEVSFTWKVSDGIAVSNVATGTITVEPNTPPAINPTLSLTFLKNSINEYDLQPYLKFIDPNFTQSHTFTLVRVPSRGRIKAGATTLTAGNTTADPTWLYTTDQAGIDSIAWRVSDGVDYSERGEVRIEVLATLPGDPDTPPAFEAGVRIMNGTEPLRTSGNSVYGNTGTLGCAAPELADWNNDGLADLVVGQRDGRVSLYLNKGTKGNPVFNGYAYLKLTNGTHIHKETFRCACFGGRWVNSTPRVVDWNHDGKKDLLVGLWGGESTDFGTSGYQKFLGVVVYLNVGTDGAPLFDKGKKFVLYSTLPKTGRATAGRPSAMPFVTDLNGDGFLDIVSGENNVWFKQNSERGTAGKPSGLINIFLGARKDMDQISAADAFYYNGLQQSVWPIVTVAGASPVGSRKSIVAVDWNGDGRKDLIVGMQDGSVWYSPNVGTPTLPVYKNHYRMKAGGADMVVGNPNKLGTDPGYNDFKGKTHLTTLSWKSPDMMLHANEARLGVGDLDGDGRTDLVAGDASGYVWFFRQVNKNTGAAPNAPTNLTAKAVSISRIDLAWSDYSSDEDGFKIERKTGSGGTWSQIATVGANVKGFANTGLSASTTYYYRVRAYNAAGHSAFSNEAHDTTQAVANQPPVLDSDPWADPNPVTLPNATTVNAVANDPDNGPQALTYAWSKVSGPGTASFSPNGTTAASTATASFSAAGSYVLRVTVSDGAASVKGEVAVTVLGGDSSGEVIVDDKDANTSKSGTWYTSSGANPYNGHSRYSNSDGTFRWTPALPADGRYEVYAWWTVHSNRSANVPYRIAHGGGTATVRVNQRESGGQWNLLGTYSFKAGSGGYVEVSSENGQACADAVRLVPQEVIVDDKDANTSKSGTWYTSSGANPYNGHSLYSNSGGTFRWTPALPADGSYEVYAWWTVHSNRSANVPYRIAHGGGKATVRVNQRESGGQWNLLGTYSFKAGSGGYVEISSENGQACADAVRWVRK